MQQPSARALHTAWRVEEAFVSCLVVRGRLQETLRTSLQRDQLSRPWVDGSFGTLRHATGGPFACGVLGLSSIAVAQATRVAQ